MPKLIKTKFTRPTSGPFNLKERTCKICLQPIPFGPCEQTPKCKAALEAVANAFLKDDEPEETKELEVKEPEPVKPPAERFPSRVLPDATGLQALMIVGQHMNTALDELMVNERHQRECYYAMTDEDRFVASALIIRINYERHHGDLGLFNFSTQHLPDMDDFDLSRFTPSVELANYLASQGFQVAVPLHPVDNEDDGSSEFLSVYWDGRPRPTMEPYASNHTIYMPTGPSTRSAVFCMALTTPIEQMLKRGKRGARGRKPKRQLSRVSTPKQRTAFFRSTASWERERVRTP